jgi:hypothetical protein
MKRLLLLLMLSLPGLTQAAGIAGYLTNAAPDAVLIRGSSVYVAAEGAAVEAGDVLQTGADGGAQVEMQDGTLLQAGPASQLHLAQYSLASGAVEAADVSLVRGWLRFVTAKLSPGKHFQYTTPTMTIGIRGTEGVLEAGEDNATLALDEGQVEVRELDAQGNLSAPRPLRGGEFIERRQGRVAQWRERHPEGWRERLPAQLRERTAARLEQLRQRGVPLRHLRAARYEDVRDLLRANPRDREHFQKRFEDRLKDPDFRQKLRDHQDQHGDWRERLEQRYGKERVRRTWGEASTDGPKSIGDTPRRRGAADQDDGARRRSGERRTDPDGIQERRERFKEQREGRERRRDSQRQRMQEHKPVGARLRERSQD